MTPGDTLVAQWLGLCAPAAGGVGSTPGQGAGILRAAQCSQYMNTRFLVDNKGACFSQPCAGPLLRDAITGPPSFTPLL